MTEDLASALEAPSLWRAWMDRCLALADEAPPLDVPVGALVLQPADGAWRVVGQAANTRERNQDPLGHAELQALSQAARTLGTWRLADCTLVVTLEPCAMCASAIAQARASRVIFGADDPLAGACGSRYRLLGPGSDAPWVAVMGGVQAAACGDRLRAFFESARQRR